MISPVEWKPLRYHPQQSKLWRTNARFVAAAAGRGSGKTELARRRIVRFLPIVKQWPDPIYAYCLPTYQQAKRIAWKAIKRLIPSDWIKGKPNETELKIETIFGSTLYIIGMDRPERAEGVQYDGVVLDESSDQKPNVFTSILPALSHRRAWCWRIGAPKRFGIGVEDFKSFFDKGLRGESVDPNDPTMRIESYTWQSEDIVDPSIIAFAKANLDPRDYAEQYNANWQDVGGAIFHSFDEVLNVDSMLTYNPNLPICIGSDFNVNPMCWVIGHRYKDRIEIFDEIFLRHVSTQQTLDYLYARYGGHSAGFEFFGDASGQARKTAASSAAQSDYLIIKNDKRFKRAGVFYLKANPPIVDRFASCNALMCATNGDRRLMVHPRCKRLISDLKTRAYKEGTRQPDDSGDVGHITDALGYLIHRVFPITATVEAIKSQIIINNMAA